MKTYDFGSFKIHELNGHIQKIYLAEYPEKLLLMDGASKSDISIIKNLITKELNKPLHQLKLVAVSHMHPDHCGAVNQLRKLTDVKTSAHTNADLWYSGLRGRLQHIIDLSFTWFVILKTGKKLKSTFHPRKIKPDFPLLGGEELPFFTDWQVIHCPGHTSHDLLLYHKQMKILYAADLILKINTKILLPFPVTLPNLMNESLEKLKNLDIETIFSAHGGIIEKFDKNQLFSNLQLLLNKKQTGFFKYAVFFTRFSNCVKRHKL
ncbi:MAG TPA: Zn-dependent hydrolase [Bacteroidales bacterium]|nr:Zn-dependent hydrolase [Bacteroidales bacterium]